MVAKAQSSNPCEAEIGRQGQAIRASCISSSLQNPNVASSADTNVSLSCRFGSSLKRQSTDITVPDTAEEMEKILQRLPRWDPGSFVRDPRCRIAPTHSSTLGTKSVRRCSPPSDLTKRQLSNHEVQSRLWGGNYFVDGPKLVETRGIPSWNERPLEEQKKLLRELKEPNLILNYPHWTKPECKGVGKYRMSVDITPDDVPQALIDRMGSTADLLGMSHGLPFEGHDGIQIEELLYTKHENEIKQRLRGPTEEMVGDTKVIRGFPAVSLKLKSVEAFLLPMTYATFEYQPYGAISAHRITQNYYLKGDDFNLKVPEETDLAYAFPEYLKDQANFPIPKGFTLDKLPGSVRSSCHRHPGIIDSDLEALPKHPTIFPKPGPNATAPAATGRQPGVGTTRRVPAAGRPGLERRTSDRGPKTKKTKASALGKKRVASAVQLSNFKKEEKPSNAQVVARPQKKGTVAQVPNMAARNVEALDVEAPENDAPENDAAWMDAPTTVTCSPSSPEDLDSPPLWLLATSSKENEAQLRSLRPTPDIPQRPSVKSSKQLLAILSKSLPLTADSTPLSLKSTSLVPVLTPAAPETAAIPISQPNTPRTSIHQSASVGRPSHTIPIPISQPFTPGMSKSPSVSKRRNTLSDRSKRRVRWSQSNLVHTSEQSGFQRNSVYNYSKPSSPQYIHTQPAARRHAASSISIPRASAIRITRQAASSISIPRASGIGTARPERQNRQGVTEIANSFALNRERLSRNVHRRHSPGFPSVPTEEFCAVVDDVEVAVEDDVAVEDTVAVEDDGEEEWEELDLPESPSPTFMPTLQHSLYAA